MAGINYFSGSTELTEKLEKLTEQMSAAEVEVEAQQDTTGPPTEVRYNLTWDMVPSLEELIAQDPVLIIDIRENDVKGKTASDLQNEAKAAIDDTKPMPNQNTNAIVFTNKRELTGEVRSHKDGNKKDDALALKHLPEIVKEARLISAEKEKNAQKPIKGVYKFLGAVRTSSGVRPIILTIKEWDVSRMSTLPRNVQEYFEKKPEEYEKLYDSRVLVLEIGTGEDIGEDIKIESDASAQPTADDLQKELGTPNPTITIAELLELVKEKWDKYLPNEPGSASVSVTADLDADTENYGEIDSSIRVPGRVEKREATQIAVTEGYPSLLNDEGEAVTAIPGWTWVRANDRGNYGVVVGKDGNMLEVFFSNKEQNVGRYVKMLPRELTAVEAQYSDPAAERPLGEPPAWMDEEDLTDPMTDEEFEQMMQEADDRESGRIRLAEELIGEGEVNTAEEDPGSIPEVKQLLEEDADKNVNCRDLQRRSLFSSCETNTFWYIIPCYHVFIRKVQYETGICGKEKTEDAGAPREYLRLDRVGCSGAGDLRSDFYLWRARSGRGGHLHDQHAGKRRPYSDLQSLL